jgi:nucleotide-binding universal stress UspA family protein
MRHLKRIVVGHDLRAGGETALVSAITLAQKTGATLRLVHVVEPYSFYQRLPHPFTTPYSLEALAQRAGERLEALATNAELAPLHIEYEVRIGKPFVELIIARRAWQADMIVVGGVTHGEGRLLGSTSARVVRKASGPVLVAKTTLDVTAKTILVPTDFSPHARSAAIEALALAQHFDGRVHFFHVLEQAYVYSSIYGRNMEAPYIPLVTPTDLQDEWEAFLAELPLLDTVSWEKRTEEGHAATAIVREAAQDQASLIVMGTHGRTGLAHMLINC